MTARPGLEPGTPRLSVVRSLRSNVGNWLQPRDSGEVIGQRQNVANSGCFCPIRGVADASSPKLSTRSQPTLGAQHSCAAQLVGWYTAGPCRRDRPTEGQGERRQPRPVPTASRPMPCQSRDLSRPRSVASTSWARPVRRRAFDGEGPTRVNTAWHREVDSRGGPEGSDLAAGGLAGGIMGCGAGGPDAAGQSPILLGRIHRRWRGIRRAAVILLLVRLWPVA